MDDLMSLDWHSKPNGNSNGVNRQQPQSSSSSSGSSLKPTQPMIRNSSNQSNNSTYNFDSLTRSLNNSSPSFNLNPQIQPQRSGGSNTSANRNASSNTPPVASASSSDAFSSLLSFDGSSGSVNSSAMSMADRQRKFEADKREKAERERKMNEARWGSGAGWESMDISGKSSSSLSSSPALAPSRSPVPVPTSSKPSPSNSSSKPRDVWDEFDSLPTPLVSKQAKPSPAIQSDVSSGRTQSSSTNRSPQPQSKPKAKSHDPFDFDSFEDPGDSQGSALGGGDFEEDDDFLGFGNSRASKPVTSETRKASIGEDDILGALGAPAPPSRKTNPSLTPGGSSSCSRVPSPADGSRAQLQSRRIGPSSSNKRPTSPPPHIVGQLVEMGFGPVEARKALAQTDSGVDVQAAAEILVGNQGSSRSRNADTGRRRKDVDGEEGSEGSAEERDRQLAWEIQREEEENMKKARRFGTGTKGGDASSNQAQPRRKPNVPPREDREREREDGDGTSTPDWQKQADQLYSQAQEISSSVFNKANAFWSSAKAQAQKALEERSAAQQAGEGSGRSSPATGSEKARNRRWGTSSNNRSDRTKEWEGKPRWMVEAEEAEANEGGAKVADNGKQAEVKSGEFKDSDDEQEQAKSQTSHATGKRPQERRPQREPASEARTNPDKDLWDLPPDSGSSKSKNPFNSSAGKQSSRSTPPPSRSTNPPKADPKVSRNLIPEDQDSSASFIPRVSQLKLSGNESFKKGSYGEAEAFYSKALENLPEKSLRRIPILNNRGNSRLKNGDSRNTIKDSNEVILLILPNGDLNSRVLAYNPNSDIGLPVHLTNEINLRDSWAKALSKKAQAEEALEKWVSARSSWENLQRFEKEFGSGKLGLQNMRASKDGIGRCEKMMSKGGGSKEPSSTAASSSRGNSSSNTAKSAAAARASRSAAEAVKRAEAAGRERVRAENAAADAEDAAKFALKDQVDGRIDDWKKGKENNIRALIASLDGLTWSELGWKKIGMHELITDAQVKKGYVRAIAKLHPDKLTAKNSTLEQRMIAAGVFGVLNEAWIATQN